MAKKTIPHFEDDEEAAEFWDTHSIVDYLDDMEPAPDVTFALSPLKQVCLRLSEAQVAELKEIAAAKGIRYQTLIRMWVTEKVQQEKAT